MNKAPIFILAAGMAFALAACSSPAAIDPVGAATPSTIGPSTLAAPSTTGSPSAPVEAPLSTGTPITITAGGTVITAILNDSQVAKDFLATLPVTLPWFRNAGIEYITELKAPLTETGPFYTDVQPGDLVYYNPADSITIIYEKTSSVPTLTKMGQITSDLSVFRNLPDNVDMRVEAG